MCDGDAVRLEVTGAIGPVLRVIADHDLVDFTCQHADLDELFLAFYRESAAPSRLMRTDITGSRCRTGAAHHRLLP